MKVFHICWRILSEIKHFLRFIWDKVRKKFLPHSLFARFVLIILIPLVVVQVIAFMMFYDYHWHLVGRRLANDVAGDIKVIVELYESYPHTLQTKATLGVMESVLRLPSKFSRGRELRLSDVPENTPIVMPLVTAIKSLGYPFIVQEHLQDDYVIAFLQLKKGVVAVTVPKRRFFSSSTYAFVVWMIGVSLLVFWISFLFMKNQVRSVTRLSVAANRFGMGRSVDNFKPEGATEVRRAGQAFMQMKERLSRYLSERTSMLAGVSHDLRTPLTRMKLQLSMMDDLEGRDDLLSDIDEMQRMLEGYLAFARGEGEEKSCMKEVSELLTSIVEKQRRLGQKIDFHVEQKQDMLLRPDAFSRAISNVLNNANRYAKSACMTMSVRDGSVHIIIDDDGPGIPAEKHNDVFRAFYRLDESRNTQTGGVGLGLTVTRDIVLSHGGDIRLEDSPMGGLRVHLQFPID